VQQVVGAVGDCGKVVEGDGDVVVLWAERVLEPASASSSRVCASSWPRPSRMAECGAVGRDVDVVGPERARADLDGARAGGSAAS
jgi:hypothetical protein